jgi:hypothetical protein
MIQGGDISRRSLPFEYPLFSVLSFCSTALLLAIVARASRHAPNSFPARTDVLPQDPSDGSLYFPRTGDDFSYTAADVQEATLRLGIPTWSRSYVNCTDDRSEVTCGQIVKAWRAIRKWELAVAPKTPKDDYSLEIVHTWTKLGGIGNRMMQEMVGGVVAMMLNRTVSVYCRSPVRRRWKGQNDYHFVRSGVIEYPSPPTCPHGHNHSTIPCDAPFYHADFFGPKQKDRHIFFGMTLLSSMVYLHPQLFEFVREAFGHHAQYFMLNYLMRIPDGYITQVTELTKAVPRTVVLFGVHLRFQYAGQYYSRGIAETLSVAVPFCQAQQARRPIAFAFCSDNVELFDRFKSKFKVISAPVYRAPDADHVTALTDLALLIMRGVAPVASIDVFRPRLLQERPEGVDY